MACPHRIDGETELTIRLTTEQLVDAARLAGFFVESADAAAHLANRANGEDFDALLLLYARIGVRRAIELQTERMFPKRYPEDLAGEEPMP